MRNIERFVNLIACAVLSPPPEDFIEIAGIEYEEESDLGLAITAFRSFQAFVIGSSLHVACKGIDECNLLAGRVINKVGEAFDEHYANELFSNAASFYWKHVEKIGKAEKLPELSNALWPPFHKNIQKYDLREPSNGFRTLTRYWLADEYVQTSCLVRDNYNSLVARPSETHLYYDFHS